MPRVHTQKAGKDYPEYGIKKGDIYYRWAFFRQRDKISKTPPSRSQLTQDEGLQQAYGVFDGDVPMDSEGVQAAIAELEGAVDLIRDKLESMPEALQEGDTGQVLQARIDSIESSAQELEQLVSDLEEAEGWEVPEKPTQKKDEGDDAFDERREALLADKPDDGVYEWDDEAWTWTVDTEVVAETFSSADQIEEG